MLQAVILFNPVKAKLHNPDNDLRYLISEILSFKVAGFEHMNAGNWDGYNSHFSMATNSFPAGFVRLVKKKLEMGGYNVITHSRDAPEPTGPKTPKVDEFPDDHRYKFQPEVVGRVLSLRGMIAQIATGGGKSRVFKLCYSRIGLPTLFLTSRKSLMYQMANNFEETMGEWAGYLGDGKWAPNSKGANFATVGTLAARLEEKTLETETKKVMDKYYKNLEKKIIEVMRANNLPTETNTLSKVPKLLKQKIAEVRKSVIAANPINNDEVRDKIIKTVELSKIKRKETIKFLKTIGFFCLEEAHEVSGNGYYNISNACSNAWYRLALTATPFMKDNQEANMRLMACTGPIGIKVSEKLLINSGILAKPYFKYIKVEKVPGLTRSASWTKAYKMGITENKKRNNSVIVEAKEAKSYGLTTMVLVNHTKHGELLKRMMVMNGLKSVFISGKDSQEQREFALNQLKSGRIDVLIGSTILDVGVDVPSVGMIILAGGGKAEVNLRQRVGRGLREKKFGPNVAFVVDFEDRNNNHLYRHYKERLDIISETEGFCENIVAKFDYLALGFSKKSK